MTPTSATILACLCGNIAASGSLLSSPKLPIPVGLCHCDTCRRTTGSLCASFLPLKSSPSADILDKLSAYSSSAKITRYFCSKCGCHCFAYNQTLLLWSCLSGIIEKSPQSDATSQIQEITNTVKVSRHEYVSSSPDGGIAVVWKELNGRVVSAYASTPQFAASTISYETLLRIANSIPNTPSPEGNSLLPARCHCGGISLLVKRATWASVSGAPARYIPSDPSKYLTYMCACRSCRLSSGVSLMPFTLVLTTNILNASSSPPTPVEVGRGSINPGLELQYNWSSPDTCRSFCRVCGATVFYWCEKRPDEIDLAVGILRAEEGSMARNWLQWEWGRCSFAEESLDRELCDAWLSCRKNMESNKT